MYLKLKKTIKNYVGKKPVTRFRYFSVYTYENDHVSMYIKSYSNKAYAKKALLNRLIDLNERLVEKTGKTNLLHLKMYAICERVTWQEEPISTDVFIVL